LSTRIWTKVSDGQGGRPPLAETIRYVARSTPLANAAKSNSRTILTGGSPRLSIFGALDSVASKSLLIALRGFVSRLLIKIKIRMFYQNQLLPREVRGLEALIISTQVRTYQLAKDLVAP
jgi:hypothetical protein